jgi:hypothetical protein
MLGGGPGAVVGVRPEMAVRGQRGVRRRVPEGSLHRDDVAAGGDQARRVEVPKVVQPQSLQAAGSARLAPLVADGVLVGRGPVRRPEEPAVGVVVLEVVLDVRVPEARVIGAMPE